MKAKSFKRVLALALAAAMVLTACGQKETNTSESKTSESKPAQTSESKETSETPVASESAETEIAREDMPVLTMFPANGSLFSGIRTGYQGDFLAKELGIQLEVWAYSDEKMNAMLASGDFPDMFYVGSGGLETLETLIETGKIINYDDYKEQLPNFFGEDIQNPDWAAANYQNIRDKFSAGTGGLYVLPSGLSTSAKFYVPTGTFDRNIVKLRWDAYEGIGAPEITDMWQLIDVVEDMLEYMPTHPDGTKMQGTFLDNGFDSDRWGSMYLWFVWHGYNPGANNRLVEVNNVTGTVESIFEDDSVYKEGVRWYNELYRRGLMDPDSISTARTDQAPKLDKGYAMMPSGTLPGGTPNYYEAFVPGTTVYFDFTNETMSNVNNCLVINAESEHIEECIAFVNAMGSVFNEMNMKYGPEGDIWEIDGDTIKITDRFAKWLKEKGNINFFPLSDGTEWSLSWNTQVPSLGNEIQEYVDIEGNVPNIMPTYWPDAREIMFDTENFRAWQKTIDADSVFDYLDKNNIPYYTESAFVGVVEPALDDNQTLTLATIKDVVVPATWQCVYAETDEEFNEIWDQMVKDAMELGAQEFIDWYIENYKSSK